MVPPERGGDTIQRTPSDKGIFQNVAFLAITSSA